MPPNKRKCVYFAIIFLWWKLGRKGREILGKSKKKWFRITIYWSRWLSQTFQTPSPSITPQFLELPQLEMIPTLPEKYKCKEFAEKLEMKRSGQVIPFKFIFFVRNKVRLYDRSWVQEKQISRWIYEMHDLYRKSWCRRSWHLMGLNFCKANFCFINSAVPGLCMGSLFEIPSKEIMEKH